MEEREHRSRESLEGKMTVTQWTEHVSTKRQRIAELARSQPELVFTSIAHLIDLEWMHVAWDLTRKDGATGVDDVDACAYARNLDSNLRALLVAFRSGTYVAPPVRRVLIPKGDGRKTRPIGIPTLEDKILQRAVVMLLECIYEQDFSPVSHGFRPGRSAHGALIQLDRAVRETGGGWVIDADIEGFFDALDHGMLRRFLDLRVRDGVIRRTIDKWLKAGAMDGGILRRSRTGSPQGGVISPILANIYLHYSLDLWFDRIVRGRTRGPVELVRYADDFLIIARDAGDAQGILAALSKRLGRFGLQLHSTKTRLVPFKQPPFRWRRENAAAMPWVEDPGTFDFLGFTHFWGGTKSGGWAMRRKTAKDRVARFLHRISDWCRVNRNVPIRDQHRILSAKLRGFGAYYAVTGNAKVIGTVRFRTGQIWRRWLSRRSQRGRMSWARFNALLHDFPLPRTRIRRLARRA